MWAPIPRPEVQLALVPLLVPRAGGGAADPAPAPTAWSIAHPFKAPGGLPIGTRTTVLRLADGSLLLHSPGALSPAELAEIGALGDVSVIFVPNREHTLFAAAARAAFPRAEVHAPASLAAAAKLGGPARAHAAAGSGVQRPFGEGLFALTVEGAPRLDETVLVHAASGVLVTADLVFHLVDLPPSFGASVLRWVGSAGFFGPTGLAKLAFFSDKGAVRRSVEQLLELPFDGVGVCHGSPLLGGAKAALQQAFASFPAPK